MAHWIGAQGGQSWSKILKNAFFVTSPRENPHPNQILFFIETKKLTESTDGLNSSVAVVAGEL